MESAERLRHQSPTLDSFAKRKTNAINSTVVLGFFRSEEKSKGDSMASISNINFCKELLEISTANRDPSGIANCNNLLGDAYVSSGEYETAIEYYKKSLEIYTGIGDFSGAIKSNSNLGITYFKLAQYHTAIQCFENGLEMSNTVGDPSGIADMNSHLGNVYVSLGKYQKAINHYKKSLEISTAIGHQSGIARVNCNLGNAYRSLGEYQKAIKRYEKSLELNSATGDLSGIGDNHCNLGSAYVSLAQYQKAINHYEKGLEISTAIGNLSGIATNNGNLGNVYHGLGEYERAINYYQKSLEISTSIGDQPGIASNNGNLGSVYLSLGEYQKAINHYETSLAISKAIDDLSGKAIMNSSLGNAYFSLGDCGEAIKYYEEGLEISTVIGDRKGIASGNGRLGNAFLSLGEYQKAINYLENSLGISTAIGDRLGVAHNNGNLGNAYLCLGKYQEAISHYEKVFEISTEIGNRSGIARSKSSLGNAHLCFGKYKDASLYLIEAIKLFDKIFFDFVPDSNKLSFTGQYFKSHCLLMSCFLSLERTKFALLVIDLGKCKELHFCIEKHRNLVDKEMKDYACTIWDRISDCEEQIEIEEITEILHMPQNDSSVLVFAFDHERFLNIWILNEGLVFRKVDANSEKFLLLISQFLEKLNVNIDRNSSFHQIDSDVSTFFPMIRKPQPKGAAGSVPNSSSVPTQVILGELFQLLIDPIKDSLKGNKLIVVPDQQLFFVPFSSLVDENGHFLTYKYSIQITPSLHTLKASMQRPDYSDFGFALFIGNPTADLPGAGKEVEYLANLFHATPLLERKARKQVVMQHLGQASIIHIAAHGEPSRGEIMLAPESSNHQSSSPVVETDSYLFTQRDITSISLQARLVVLCCCHTGKGKVSSEGVIGTTRAFLAAGARSVLATLWPIDDEATNEFMEKFYSELCEETPVCEALRRTMVLFQNHEKSEYRSSRIWAPFTIYGEDVNFKKHEIGKIREKSREMFSDFVVLP